LKAFNSRSKIWQQKRNHLLNFSAKSAKELIILPENLSKKKLRENWNLRSFVNGAEKIQSIRNQKDR